MTKILLVEDDKSLREIYGVRLLAEGYDIVSAGDGEEALAMAIKERPELIVSDVMMPKISGFDMLDILRSTTETKDIKVIMMTALSSEDQRARGEALGADRYLVKSQVGIEDVVRTVHEVLGDAPTLQPTAASAFATPAPSAAPRAPSEPAPRPTAPPYPPVAPATPQPTPIQPQPVAQAPAPAPSSQPVSPLTPTANSMAPTPAASLPLPTAPFSTPRPASLGDRVINPLVQQGTRQPDMASLMSQELDRDEVSSPSVAPQSQPQAPVAPQPQPSQPVPATPPATVYTAAPVAPTPTGSSFAQPGEPHGATNITFEETPLTPSSGSQTPPMTPPSTGMVQ